MTPEEEKLLDELPDELIAEMCDNPPIKCPASFTWDGDEAKAREVLLSIGVQALLLRRVHPWLNFDSLESVVFHDDYLQALSDVSKLANRVHTPTVENTGAGVAMVVHLQEKCIAVFDASLAHGVLEKDFSVKDMCVDLILHELCHAHDFSRKKTLLKDEFLSRKLLGVQRYTFNAADAAWCEYFANKYSTTARSSADMHPKLLADVVPDVFSSLRSAVIAYRLHANLDALLEICEAKIRFLFQCFGYAAGRLVANGEELRNVAPQSHAEIEKAGLVSIWDSVLNELIRLDECQESWASFDELDALMANVSAVYRKAGLHLRDEADGSVYVGVPFIEAATPWANIFTKIE